MPKFEAQTCMQHGCAAAIVSSYFVSKKPEEPKIVCETCYRQHHYGKESYVKTYKHLLCNDIITNEVASQICKCTSVKRHDSTGKAVDLYPYDDTAGHQADCGLSRLSEVEAQAKFEGILAVSGRNHKTKLAEVVHAISMAGGSGSKMQPSTSENGNKRATGTKKRLSSVLSGKDRTGWAEKSATLELPSAQSPGAITDPAEDNHIPAFFDRFADKDGLKNVHMSLRVGTLVFQIGVAK